MITENGKTLIRNNRFIAFKAEEIPARITSIIYSIKQAIGQLSGTVPTVIYVDISGVVQSMTVRDFERLYHSVENILRNNSSISMITLTAEFTGNSKTAFIDMIGYGLMRMNLQNINYQILILLEENRVYDIPKHYLRYSFSICL